MIVNGTHNDSWFKGGKEYVGRLRDFMVNVLSLKDVRTENAK